jgi:hypothetical protein
MLHFSQLHSEREIVPAISNGDVSMEQIGGSNLSPAQATNYASPADPSMAQGASFDHVKGEEVNQILNDLNEIIESGRIGSEDELSFLLPSATEVPQIEDLGALGPLAAVGTEEQASSAYVAVSLYDAEGRVPAQTFTQGGSDLVQDGNGRKPFSLSHFRSTQTQRLAVVGPMMPAQALDDLRMNSEDDELKKRTASSESFTESIPRDLQFLEPTIAVPYPQTADNPNLKKRSAPAEFKENVSSGGSRSKAARGGTYADNAFNRSLGRAGLPIGSRISPAGGKRSVVSDGSDELESINIALLDVEERDDIEDIDPFPRPVLEKLSLSPNVDVDGAKISQVTRGKEACFGYRLGLRLGLFILG